MNKTEIYLYSFSVFIIVLFGFIIVLFGILIMQQADKERPMIEQQRNECREMDGTISTIHQRTFLMELVHEECLDKENNLLFKIGSN